MSPVGRFPDVFPEFIVPDVVPATAEAAGNIWGHWRSCARPMPNAQFTEDPVENARRRFWYFVRTGQSAKSCPGHQKTVTGLSFDFFDHAHVWAGATTINSVNVIGASAGLARNYSAFTHALLSHPEVLPDLGNSAEEISSFDSMRECDWMADLADVESAIRWSNLPLKQLPAPRTFERKKIAELLTAIAMDFVFWHEISHLRRGHVHYLLKEHGNPIYGEFDGQIADVDVRHALELDADNGALEIMIWPVLKGGTIRSFQMEKKDGPDYLEMFFLATGFLFLMFDCGTTPDTEYSKSTHPHPLIRYWNLVTHAIALARSERWDLERLQDIAINALHAVGIAAIATDLPNAIMAETGRLGMRGVSEEQQRITANINTLVSSHPSLRI